MRIKSLELVNWGPHKKRSFDFDASIVGIVGANGKGKSNLLQAIDYALTGNLNKQKQEKYIRNYGHPDGAKSASVTLVFEKGGKECTISRTITATGSKRKLTWDGSEWTKAADVEQVLETILEADKASLAHAVFVKQGELARLVKGTPAERQTIFQKLMNLGFLDSCPDDISAKIGVIRGSLQDIRPALTLAEQDYTQTLEDLKPLQDSITRYEELQSVISKLSNIRVALRDKEELQARLLDHSNTIQAATTKLQAAEFRLGGNLVAAKAKLHELNSEQQLAKEKLDRCIQQKWKMQAYTTAKQAHQQAQQACDALPSVTVLQMQQQAIKEQTEALTAIRAYVSELNSIQSRLASAAAAYKVEDDRLRVNKEIYDTDAPVLQEKISAAKQIVAQLETKINHAKARLFAFKGGTTDTVCPICNTPMTASHFRQEGESEQDCKARLNADVDQLEAEWRKHFDKQMDYEQQLASLGEYLNSKALTTLQTLRDKEMEALEAHKKTVPAFYDSEEHTLAYLDAQLHKMATKANDVAQQIGQCQAAMNTLMLTELQLETAQKAVEDLEELDEAELRKTYDSAHEAYLEFKELCDAAELAKQTVTAAQDISSTLTDKLTKVTAKATELWKDAEEDSKVVEAWFLIDAEEKLNRGSSIDVDAVIAGLQEVKNEASQAYAQYKQLMLQKDKLEQRIGELKELLERNADKLRLIDDLNTVKSMVMRTGVPLAFMNDVFYKLIAYVQDLLLRMEANFTVLPDKERACSFLFMRTDNDSSFEMQQEQLSGGQAIRLSLAMLLACQQIVLPEVGLLVLDEPSSHIDSAGVEQMRDMFLSLQHILQNSDMQLIIVDHNEKLTTAFETTVTL